MSTYNWLSNSFYLQTVYPSELKMKDIRFSYPLRPTVQVLKDVSIDVPAGQTVAIVGASGSGKSTIVSLIERFYDPVSGSILLGDTAVIDTLNMSWYRRGISIVSQEPVLFDMSIADNIAYGALFKTTVSMSEIIEAATSANIHTFIQTLPQVIMYVVYTIIIALNVR